MESINLNDQLSTVVNPKFSIIIPVYNVEKYLVDCIKSIQNQTFDNFEAIFINDGSTDNCKKILSDVSDNRIKVIHKTNGGVSSARNLGLDEASGEYILFCDPDDQLLPDSLEIFNKTILKFPSADWIRGNNLVSSPNGSKRKENLHLKRAPYVDKLLPQEIWFQHIVNAGEIWATVFKRNKIEELKLRFDPKLRTGEDGIWLLDYTMTGEGVYIEDEVYDYLFQRSDGLSFTRAKTEADCISIVEVPKQWRLRMSKFPKNSIMYSLCRFNYLKRVRNGIGGLTFVPRKLRMNYLKQLKALCPRIELNFHQSKREYTKAVMYNYFLWTFLLPSPK